MEYAIVQALFDIRERDREGQKFTDTVNKAMELGFKSNGPHSCVVFVDAAGQVIVILIQSLVKDGETN